MAQCRRQHRCQLPTASCLRTCTWVLWGPSTSGAGAGAGWRWQDHLCMWTAHSIAHAWYITANAVPLSDCVACTHHCAQTCDEAAVLHKMPCDSHCELLPECAGPDACQQTGLWCTLRRPPEDVSSWLFLHCVSRDSQYIGLPSMSYVFIYKSGLARLFSGSMKLQELSSRCWQLLLCARIFHGRLQLPIVFDACLTRLLCY